MNWFKKKDRFQELLDESQENFVGEMERALKKILNDTDQAPCLKEKIQKLKDEVADLQTAKKQELRDIEHLVKIKEEKLNIEHQKSELTLKDQYKDKEMELQTEYFEKVMKQVETAKTDMQKIYEQILLRLPNLNASLEIKRRKG